MRKKDQHLQEVGQLANHARRHFTRNCNQTELEEQRLLGETLVIFGQAVEQHGLQEMPAIMDVIERYGKLKYPNKKSVFPPCPDSMPLHLWIGRLYRQVGNLLLASAKDQKTRPLEMARVMLGPVN